MPVPRVRTWNHKTTEQLLLSPEWKSLLAQRDWYPIGIKTHFLFMFPQFMASVGVASTFPPGFTRVTALYEDRYMRGVYDPREFSVLAREIIRRTELDPAWIDQYEADFLAATQRLTAEVERAVFDNVERDARMIVERLVRLIDVEVEAQSYGYLTHVFTLTREEYWVSTHLAELAPELRSEDRAILMQPTRPSFLQDYQEAIHQIESGMSIEEVQRGYFWIKTSYETVSELTEAQIRADALLSGEGAFDPVIIQKKVQLIEVVKESERLAAFVHVLDVLVALQDTRKANVLRSNYAIYHLLLRLQPQVPEWSIHELLSFTPTELISLVDGTLPVDQRERIQARNHRSVWVATPAWFAVSTHDEPVQALSKLLEPTLESSVKGFVAYKGTVRGSARIILSEHDFAKMQPGDILITSMTRPEFLPMMRKASAFVTNEGGITCHAAVVARELQKPCIIGTRTATTSFKDGEMIEVDAEKGIVRKI
ncbi:hypothetical protein KBD61_00815 [Patescibacteria group bacterium]|nr:hypothetical protein [Patescibacteria group bacterium]MBP9709549.1 hypothetical protein [Patescibacteria group bacterium]